MTLGLQLGFSFTVLALGLYVQFRLCSSHCDERHLSKKWLCDEHKCPM
jgi:hypothetical protein